jgi:predicted enzyme related to lactoylglutathione lyase
MTNILGIGGVFVKVADPAAWADWYKRVLEIDMANWGHCQGTMFPAEALAAKPGAGGVFSGFAADTQYFAPSTAAFMINLVVADLDAALARAASEGVTPTGPILDEVYGRFAHILDPAGIKLELWEPKGPG